MDLYRQHRYNAALEQQVEERISRSNDASIGTELSLAKGSAGRRVTTELFRNYIERAEPITVIGIVIDVLEGADDVVHVDLLGQRVTDSGALARTVGRRNGQAARPRTIRLRDIDAFVSVRGLFKKASQTKEETIFLAPYGELSDPEQSPRVRLKCVTNGLRDTVPDGMFYARCLGKVETWDPRAGELTIHPIAIFK